VAERRRFLIEPAEVGDTVRLGPSEGRHALRALRLRVGQKMEAVDGLGWEYLLELCGTAGAAASARVLEKRRAPAGWGLEVIVAAGVVKGARMDWAVEKAAELGARAFIPVRSERALAVPDPLGAKLERWRRIAGAALKQSLGPHLMRVSAPRDFEYLASLASRVHLALLADQDGPPLASLPSLPQRRPSCLLIVGPEGGFSEWELRSLVDAGAIKFSLGSGRLRSETVVAGALTALWVARQRESLKGGSPG
jgi:16S rRNA (uracil1498-N3)-methyltransferase